MGRKHLAFFSVVNVILFCLCALSVAEDSLDDGLVIKPSVINLQESGGRFARARVIVLNNLNHSVDVRVKELTGEITRAIPSINKVRIILGPGDTRDLDFEGYVLKDSLPGNYVGEVVLTADSREYRILVNLTILKSIENASVSLQILPAQADIQPGQTLELVSTIKWPGEAMDFLYKIQLLDPDTGEEILSRSENITVKGVGSITTNLEIPADIGYKKYIVQGTLYSLISSDNITSSTAQVQVKSPDIFYYIRIPRLTTAQIQLIIMGVLVLAVLSTIYFYHRQEAVKKKRYLESIDFTTLPRKGRETGFIGVIAETGVMAYMGLDQLQIHAMIAGATGTGKTVAAQILAEEALVHKKAVLVFDPTAQWTGFLRSNKDRGMFRLYRHFHMNEKGARAFTGNIYDVRDPDKRINLKKYMNPGEISIFCLNNLDSSKIDIFIENTIKEVFAISLEESPELKVLFIYDEIHRLLPKFGGVGRGLLQIDRAVREFRKWGIGLILISQVLSDFAGEIRANIGTEIQLRTRYEDDLKRVRMKYGEDTFKSVVKASVGTGMLQNAQYNKGRPYFISFRPLLHDPKKLGNHELELYARYNVRFDSIQKKIETLSKSDVDTFNVELELNLARENLMKGSFTVVDLYLTSLEPHVDGYFERLKSNRISEDERAIRSEWEAKKEEDIREYETELKTIIDEQKGSLSTREKLLTETERREMGSLDMEKKELLTEEAKVKKELELLERKLESRSRVLEILKRFHERIVILNEDVMQRESEKLGEEGELELAKEKEKETLMLRKRDLLDREKKTMSKIELEKRYLEEQAQRLRKRLGEINRDKELILERDRGILDVEEKLKHDLMDKIRTGVEERKYVEDRLSEEESVDRRAELERDREGVEKKLQEDRVLLEGGGRKSREELKRERDMLRTQLMEMRDKWKVLLEKEQELAEKEVDLNKRISEQKDKMEGQEIDWKSMSFEDMELMWSKMDQLRGEKERLEQDLKSIRDDLGKWQRLRREGEEKIYRT